MKVVTGFEMEEIDKRTTEEYGIPSIILMENAGLRCSEKIIELFQDSIFNKRVAIFSGPGNNGGDGLVIARHLFNQGVRLRVFLVIPKDKVSELTSIQLNIVEKLGIPVTRLSSSKELDRVRSDILASDLIIDAILGTGTKGTLKGIIKEVIDFLATYKPPIVSIDIPSGLDATTGFPLGTCILATHTLTLGLPKLGLVIYPGKHFVGRLTLLDIGFPRSLLDDKRISTNLLIKDKELPPFPNRLPDVHKGGCGRVVVIAGSIGFTGAAALTSDASLRIGAGLVTLCIPRSLNSIMEMKLQEVITKPLPETSDISLNMQAYEEIMELSSGCDCLAIGPGLGRNPETQELVRKLIQEVDKPIVLDADGINALQCPKILLATKNVVITPHPGEMARLLKKGTDEIQKDRIGISREFAKDYKVVVVLKGAGTVIADPKGDVYINSTGNPSMATAGTGDVLTGMLAGLIAQGMDVISASCLSVYLHGVCGDLAAEKKGVSLIASDLISEIPGAINSLSL
ncbi:MAG: NAD(P)H-hydrate dehydratase [bacterium]|nr:NAD(P)H-hydrate dehydratase [bacterium]